MTNWVKIKGHGKGAKPRTTPAVQRSGKSASLVLPHTMVVASRTDVLSDGNGRIAFRLHDNGDRSIFKAGGDKSRSVKINIPADFADRIPSGTTDVELTKEGDLLVLDLKSIGGDA